MLNSLEVAGGDTVNEVGMGTPVERREKKSLKKCTSLVLETFAILL